MHDKRSHPVVHALKSLDYLSCTDPQISIRYHPANFVSRSAYSSVQQCYSPEQFKRSVNAHLFGHFGVYAFGVKRKLSTNQSKFIFQAI